MVEEDQLASLKIDRSARRGGGTLPWVVVIVLLAGAGAAAASWWLSRPGIPAVRTVAARAARVDSGDATVLNASGYVTARRQATVSSKVTGRLVEVLIEEGMEVRQDQLMARLDDSNVRASLELARSEAAAARTALEETRVRLEEAQLDLGRLRELRQRDVTSQAELDRAQAQVDSLAARIEAQRDEIEVADRRLGVWRQELADREIRAPFDGVVVSKDAQPGEMVSPVSAGGGFTRTGIATVVDMSSLEIEVDVNENYINRVRPGQPVEATLDAYPDWRVAARVIAIVPTADRQRATVKVRIGFDELDPRILPDMGVKVAFREPAAGAAATAAKAGEAPVPGVIVPAEALRQDREIDVVFVLEDGVVRRRPVELGDASGGDVTVLSGLSAGELVVLEGPEALQEGDEVREARR